MRLSYRMGVRVNIQGTEPVRPGTGKILKFFRIGKEPLKPLQDEIALLSPRDFEQLLQGLEDGTLTY